MGNGETRDSLIQTAADVAWQLSAEELEQVVVIPPSSLSERAIDWVRSLNPSRFKVGEATKQATWDEAVREARKKASEGGIVFVGPM